MADAIGLRRSWFQNKTFPHYDLTASKRKLAIAKGAIEIGYGEFPDDLLVKYGERWITYQQKRERIQIARDARHAAARRHSGR